MLLLTPRSRRFAIGLSFVRTRRYLFIQGNAQVANLREREHLIDLEEKGASDSYSPLKYIMYQ